MNDYPTKVIRPLLAPGTLHRLHLFKKLVGEQQRPLTWIAAPPGAGKTTLVGSYIEHNGLTCIWYQLDRGDADPATFFHYLGLALKKAAPRARRALPRLSPEHLPNLGVFARRYFEELCRCLKQPCVLVFDNYQDVPSEASLHEVMHNGLSVLPPGIEAIILSRTEPPAAFARLRASQQLKLLDGEQIRLTPEEFRQIAKTRNPQVSEPALARLYEQTAGWAAGLVLAMERHHESEGNAAALPTPQAVFDYFAQEVFERMDEQAQQLLLQCAVPPWVSATQAEQLTGSAQAGALLSDLSARNYFTVKDASSRYQLHPLFREFLLTRCRRTHDETTLAALRSRAAMLMEAAGDVPESVELLVEAGAWREALEAICRHARTLWQQGRGQTLEKWLRSMPVAWTERDPWSLYWLGMCRLPFDPEEARALLEAAFECFEARSDLVGSLRCWAAIVDTIIYGWGDFSALDRWIAHMDGVLARTPVLPSPELEEQVVSRMFSALMWRQVQRADLPDWAERMKHVVLESDDARLKTALGTNLVMYFLWMGELAQADWMMDALRPALRANANDPLTQLSWWAARAMYHWYIADPDACLAAVTECERVAEASGVHLMDVVFLSQGVYGCLLKGDARAASVMLDKMAAIDSPRLMHKMMFHYHSATVHWHRRDLVRARLHGESAVELASRTGAPVPIVLTRVELACTLFEQGEHEAAAESLALAVEAGCGAKHIEFMSQAYVAHFAFERGEQEAAENALRRAMQLGSRYGYMNMPRWNGAMMARLCAVALEREVEVEYVQGLIRRWDLRPEARDAGLEAWPWSVRIRTLGESSVQVNGEPLDLTTRDRRRPGELLKVLLALGGRNVNVAAIAEQLWPDAEGDAAYQALHTNLHRLRKLLGKDVLRSEAGCISLDDGAVWVDLWAVHGLVTQLESALEASAPQSGMDWIDRGLSRLMALYRGPFLKETGQVEWAFQERQRLQRRLVRLLMAAGRRLEQQGAWARMEQVYEWGLEQLDPTLEPFCTGAMRASHRLGHQADVVRHYRRYSAALTALLQVAPSPELEGLYRSLTDPARRAV